MNGTKNMRIGLIADTHMPGSREELWPQVFTAFSDVDCILHAGDLHTLDVVNQLESLAPVYVAKGNGDVDIEDGRVKDNWILDFGGISVAMIHRLPSPDRRAHLLSEYASRHFGVNASPDVVIYGHTHQASVHHIEDRLYVNPGSPTLPRNQSLRLGTIGFLELQDHRVTATIVQLTPGGTEPHAELEPLSKALDARLAGNVD